MSDGMWSRGLREDLARVRSRQRLVTETLREHQVRHPADLPVAAILGLRAARLEGRF